MGLAEPTTEESRVSGPTAPTSLGGEWIMFYAKVLFRVAAALIVLLSTSCAGVTPGPLVPERRLPQYSGRAVALFDDRIEPQAVGYSLEPTTPPQTDRLLHERTRTGDWVVRARVVSVTSLHTDSGPSWHIGFHTEERLAGDRPRDADFALRVTDADPGAGIVRTFDGRLIGKTFIAFLREFAREDGSGEGDLHFHLAGGDKDELGAVRVAALLDIR